MSKGLTLTLDTPDGGRRYRLEARAEGGFFLVTEEWTGCTWRPCGREPVDDVGVEIDGLESVVRVDG